MSFIIAAPEMLTDAAKGLAHIASTISAANAAAAAPTTGIVASAADEVSAAVAAMLSQHGTAYQELCEQATAFHTEFVETLRGTAGAYLAAEAANASRLISEQPLQTLARDALGYSALSAIGGTGGTSATGAGAGVGSSATGVVPLHMNGPFPTVNVSVNGGPSVPLTVDTGSNGLLIPFWDIGLLHLGFPTDIGILAYGNGVAHLWLGFNAPVNFGNGLVTAPTPISVDLLEFPISLNGALIMLNGNGFGGADGILGIGANAVGSHSSVIMALPDQFNQGVLINEPAGYLQFGPNPLPGITVSGAPVTSLDVQINGGPLQQVLALLDSGGVYGAIPSSLLGTGQISGSVPVGTTISVYTNDLTPLYSYTTSQTNSPLVTSGQMNSGYTPFAQGPVYLGYSPTGVGTTTFDY
ncbi:PecA family PE domain-processing aspartic protease [Mycobacterium sp. E787]|uniref:PecA family PE domain-processing aspartic protease n=1 Tax=Mycobacterium sp. E787 TaxID=1834150 RepID=UPI0008015CC8|nr:PecA family PE domain-processing aspartic protease [Mycobacterium sp. E787]OBI52744.1 hypothetical protein A5705_05205 [Mycobacterium sp. E787]